MWERQRIRRESEMRQEMLEIIQILGPIIVGLAGLFLGFVYNQRSLKQKQHEDERKEIYKKLNSFYGPTAPTAWHKL